MAASGNEAVNVSQLKTLKDSITPQSIGAATEDHIHSPSSLGITAASIGAAKEDHTHNAFDISGGTLPTTVIPTIPTAFLKV